MASGVKSVGFIVDGNLPSFGLRDLRRLGPLSPFHGSRGSTAMGEMRFGWIADAVNCRPEYGLCYDLYRPFRRYDMLVFVKSMTPDCLQLAREYHRSGRCVLFEINVNYFNIEGAFYYEGMKPTLEQRANAIAMAEECDGIIAASLFIEDACRSCNHRTTWIPDNVNLEMVPAKRSYHLPGKRLRLLWSGQALKLFDLLAVEDVLRKLKDNLELVLVTTDLSALELVYEPYRSRLKKLLGDLECRIVRYESITQLMQVYGEGGVLISPRFLDSSCNLGHTEWKITLGMACGRVAVCSPQQSYIEVSNLSGGKGIRICRNSSEWAEAFDGVLSGRFTMEYEEDAARKVVAEHYSTAVVAGKHARFIMKMSGTTL